MRNRLSFLTRIDYHLNPQPHVLKYEFLAIFHWSFLKLNFINKNWIHLYFILEVNLHMQIMFLRMRYKYIFTY